MSEAEITGIDGTVRKAHYGVGKQPWDEMKELGWAEHFAAGCVLKYVRRYKAKNGQDDLDKAGWYWAELGKLGKLGEIMRDRLRFELKSELNVITNED